MLIVLLHFQNKLLHCHEPLAALLLVWPWIINLYLTYRSCSTWISKYSDLHSTVLICWLDSIFSVLPVHPVSWCNLLSCNILNWCTFINKECPEHCKYHHYREVNMVRQQPVMMSSTCFISHISFTQSFSSVCKAESWSLYSSFRSCNIWGEIFDRLYRNVSVSYFIYVQSIRN